MMGEAGAIGSSKYKNLKLKKEEKRNSGLRTGLYSPLQVTCRLRTVCNPSANCP